MAITKGDVHLWLFLKAADVLPLCPSVLEIGQANWYDPIVGEETDPFALARQFYRSLFGCNTEFEAIDFDGPDAKKLDLNNHRGIGMFVVVINTGTTEHVFNQAQVFKTIHESCLKDGLMFHSAPVHGWQNHGFYTYSPCLFVDLARENKYQFLGGCFSEFPSGQIAETDHNLNPPVFEGDGMLHVAYRKTSSDPFRVPIQGRYRNGG